MLHSLFDEYRFLHKYPHKHLQFFSQLFGDVINHELVDDTLMVIALKFVFEAFRREGKRQKFAVITLKRFWKKIPQQKEFFDNIYKNRNLLSESDPETMRKIEELYEQDKKQKKDNEEAKKGSHSERQNKEKKWQNKKDPLSTSVDPSNPQMTLNQESKKQEAMSKQALNQLQHMQNAIGSDQKDTSQSVDKRTQDKHAFGMNPVAQEYNPKSNKNNLNPTVKEFVPTS